MNGLDQLNTNLNEQFQNDSLHICFWAASNRQEKKPCKNEALKANRAESRIF